MHHHTEQVNNKHKANAAKTVYAMAAFYNLHRFILGADWAKIKVINRAGCIGLYPEIVHTNSFLYYSNLVSNFLESIHIAVGEGWRVPSVSTSVIAARN